MSGQRTGTYLSTSSRVTDSMILRKAGLVDGEGCKVVGGNMCTFPTEETNATISIP